MGMHGVEKAHGNACIEAVLRANDALLNQTVSSALEPLPAYGKGDTLGLDATPEICITYTLGKFDDKAIVISEEASIEGEEIPPESFNDKVVMKATYISDPLDRSSQLKFLLNTVPDSQKTQTKIRDLVGQDNFVHRWERYLGKDKKGFGKPAQISGACIAVTHVRRGVPTATVIVNIITQELYVACGLGCFVLNLRECDQNKISIDYMAKKGTRIYFPLMGYGVNPDLSAMRTFVTFCGKEGYKENFLDSRLMHEHEMNEHMHYDIPGGPLRVLYLSSICKERVEFVLSNGEKITEWIHWIPFIRFGGDIDNDKPSMRMFEVHEERPHFKNSILMATPSVYSVLQKKDGQMVIDLERFPYFNKPSHIRSTLLVIPSDNAWATDIATKYRYREIVF